MSKPIATVAQRPGDPWHGVVIGGIAFTHFREREHAVGVAAVINGAIAGLSAERDELRLVLAQLLDAYNSGDMAAWLEAADAARQALARTGEARP